MHKIFCAAEYGLQIIYDEQKCEYRDDNSDCKTPAVTATSAPESVFSFKISWLHKIPFFFNSLLMMMHKMKYSIKLFQNKFYSW
jgi:hypothetical protein